MKIIQILPGRVWGGAEQYVRDLADEEARRGNDVTLLCRSNKAVSQHLSDNPLYRRTDFSDPMSWRYVKTMREMLSGSDVDVVHIHSLQFVAPTMLARRLAHSQANVVLTYHNAHRNKVMPWLRPAFKRLHAMIFVSRFAYNRWHNHNRWMPESLCHPIINSVRESTPCVPGALRKLYDIPPTSVLGAFSGRVRRSKGCETIIRAMAYLKDLDYDIVMLGSCAPSDYQQQLEGLATELGVADRIYFHGFTSDAPSLSYDVDFGIAPSIMKDPCPLSPFEFLQAGKLVIVSNSGGQPEYVSDGETGLIIEPDNPRQLAAAMRRAITDSKLRDDIGRRAKEHFTRDLSYQRFVDRILSTYS